VTSSALYKIDLTENFKGSLKTLHKNHYGKRNLKNRKAFDDELERLLVQLETSPRSVPFSWPEPWPNGTADPRFDLFKRDFRLPGCSHAAQEGRVMWLVCDSARIVSVIWIYTHAEFEKRPDDKNLKRVLQDAMSGAVAAVLEGAPPKADIEPAPIFRTVCYAAIGSNDSYVCGLT